MTPPHPLDIATALEGDPASPLRVARTSERYWTFISPFGGASAATALRAVLERPERQGDPVAATVNFCAPIAAGTFEVATRLVRANRSSQHWNVEFKQGDGDGPVLTASFVLAIRRETWRHQPAAAHAFPPAESLALFPGEKALPWVRQYELRFVEGAFTPTEAIAEPPASARSRLWLRDAQPRPLDFVSLLAMSDAFFGRIFQVVGRVPPFGTVSMTTHFHASSEELAAHGTKRLAATVDARVFHRRYADQTAELWGGDRLFATATQMAYYRL